MMLNILVAPNGFKECLSASAAAEAIASGVQRALPSAQVVTIPMVDGGEGFVDALVTAASGIRLGCYVSDPLGRRVPATIGMVEREGKRTALIEIAQAAGLRLLAPEERDMLRASSAGVGQLIRFALNHGAEHIIVGCGDSGVNDGGAGFAQELGVRFLDSSGRTLSPDPISLTRLARIDTNGVDRRIANVRIEAAVNWHNVLLGPKGVTHIYGPQKGATPDQIEILEAALERYAHCLFEATGHDVRTLNGAGASGGIGATLAAICGATLRPRLDIVAPFFSFDQKLAEADCVITAEGAIDWQTPFGKIPAEIGRRASALGKPVVVLAGCVRKGAEDNHQYGISAMRSVVCGPCSLEQSKSSVTQNLTNAAEQTMRMILAGAQLQQEKFRNAPTTDTNRQPR